jgi:hypothetical protein
MQSGVNMEEIIFQEEEGKKEEEMQSGGKMEENKFQEEEEKKDEEMQSGEKMAESIFQEEEEEKKEDERKIVQEESFITCRQSEGSASFFSTSEDNNNALNRAFSESMEESRDFVGEEECEEEPAALTPLAPQPVSILQKSVVTSTLEKSVVTSTLEKSLSTTTRLTRRSSSGLYQASGEDEENETTDNPLNVALMDSPPPLEDASISIFSSRYLEEEQENANLLLERNANLEENNEQGISLMAPAGESLFEESLFQTSNVEEKQEEGVEKTRIEEEVEEDVTLSILAPQEGDESLFQMSVVEYKTEQNSSRE